MSEITAGLQQENSFSGEFVPVLYAHLSAFDQTEFLECSEVMRNQLLALFQTLGQFCLCRELAQASVLIKEVENFPLQAVGVGRKRGNGEVFFLGARVKLIRERVESDQPPVVLTPNVLFGFEDSQMVGDLAVAHVQSTHQGTEMAPWVGCQVPHQATSLIASVRGFVRFAKKTEEPQARHGGGETKRFIGGGSDDE